MIGVYVEDGQVLLYLGSRRKDVLLDVDAAYQLSEHLSVGADRADESRKVGGIYLPLRPTKYHGQQWGVKVESYDGTVAIRFRPPESGAGDRVPIPTEMARHLAGLVRFKAQQAAYKLRFAFAGEGTGKPRPRPRQRPAPTLRKSPLRGRFI